MNILAVGPGWDTGGQGARLVAAFRKWAPDWSFRSMVREANFMGFAPDLPFRRRSLEEQYQACDVFHARLDFGLYDQLAAKFGPKPVVLHVHGTKYRADPNRFVREARERGAVILCSTLDLWLLAPDDSVWLPSPYEIDELQSLR